MLTRCERRKLSQQGITCELLDTIPKIKKSKKSNNVGAKTQPVIQSVDDKKHTDNVNCVDDQSDGATITNYESSETGYSSAPDSTPHDVNSKSGGIHSEKCYCDCIILPPTESVTASKTVANNMKATKKIRSRAESKVNRQPNVANKQAQSSVKSIPMLEVRPTRILTSPIVSEPISQKSLASFSEETQHLSAAKHTSMIDDSRLNDWFTNLQHNIHPVASKSKVKVLEILYLPPGTIDPNCPIDIFEQPIDLSMKRNERDSDPKPLDLSMRTELPTSQSVHVSAPSPQASYDEENEVLFLDASYVWLNSSACSARSEYCESPLLDQSQNQGVQQKCYEDEADCCSVDVEPSTEIPGFSKDLDIRLRVYEILDYPCFRFFGYGTCTRNPCKFRHDLVEPEDLQEILQSESITMIGKCYAVVYQFNSLFIKYFQLFCTIFGRHQMIDTLIGMISHCELPKRPVSFYRHVITGLRQCKLDNAASYECLIQNFTLKSPKSFNVLIWIMADLDVVVKFRDQLNIFLQYKWFYISAQNLTRLLGVCSRTKDCELIRIIYEVVENYPVNVKNQLHWGVRPQFIRMELEG